MGETFYTVLDVAPDADRETIRRAYRDRVKDVHPDVSDDPAATESFKQLTTTRDVLLDREERRRYDRLGHDEYVREHVNSPVWTPSDSGHGAGTAQARGGAAGGYGVGASGRSADGASTATGGRRRHSRRTAAKDGVDATAGRENGRSDYDRRSSRTRRRSRNRHWTGDFVQDSWQTASEAYRRTETEFDTGHNRPLYGVALAVRRLAPWLLVHTVLIASTLATIWFAFTSTNPQAGAAVSTFVGAVALVSVVVSLSVFHILSMIYT